jgi:dTDP-4-amino-4,6-dideoxygalactose transaminase
VSGAERILLSSPDVGPLEREALLRAFDSGWVAPVGPELDAFEADLAAFTGWPGTVAMSSGTGALHLALLAHGVGPGDEVLVSSFTFAATANAVTYTGATPKFVDSETVSWNLDPQLLADELAAADAAGRLPAAVVAVDLYGQCADYDAIVPLCAQYGVPLVEDAAEALGSTHGGSAAGTLGDIGILSFNGNKIITTSGGGALLSPDTAVADRVRYLATQARQPAVHYEHTDVGFNYRLSNLLAAMGRAQLERLPSMSARRLAINEHYRRELADVSGLAFMPIAPWSTAEVGGHWNGWLTCVTFDDPADRDRVQEALSAAEIESRPLWKPMHLQPVFASAPARVNGTSERLFDHGLCLPSGSVLTDAQVDRVVSVVRSA